MKFTLDPQAFKPAMLWRAFAMVVMLAALWMAWSSWDIFSANRLTHKTDAIRRRIADEIGPQLQSSMTRLNGLKNRVQLLTALKRQDKEAAKSLVLQALSTAQSVEFIAPDLAAAYANPAAFGYGKLGILETALQKHSATIAVLKEANSPQLALALPVLDQGRILSLIYVQLPIDPLLVAVKDTAPPGAYVALRQGHYNIAESGAKQELQFKAEIDAIKFEGTPLRVVAVAPLVPAGLYGFGGMGELIMALVLALASAGLWWWSQARERAGAAKDEESDDQTSLTLAQMQSAGQIPAPEPSPAAARIMSEMQAIPKVALDRNIFRAYDIRGVVGETLDVDIARLIGEAIGSIMVQCNQRSIVVGRDGRLSSPSMAQALIQGLRKAGRDVIDIGEAPTPLVYFGTYHLRTGCGVAVTGSHNPPDYNGFKVVIDTETLSGEAIQDIYQRIVENRLHISGTLGQLSQRDLKSDYISRVAGDIQIERKLKVVIDCGNGVAGALAPELLEAIGAQVEPLFCEVDGTFPHHHPDPSDPANMQDLIRVVQRVGADIGLALDGDGDRLGVVTKNGEMIYPDRLLMLFAADVLERNPGACVIYDVKCTGHLATQILRYGGSPLMWKTGHSFIKSKMKETEAELAGEMSGHFFFRERWYGFDDGLYAAARLLEILASRPDDVDTIFAALPKGVSTPEIKIELTEGEQYRYVEKFVAQAKFEGARIATIDGLRADWPDGWGLVRASNTTPVLVLRFDANDKIALARIQTVFREQMLAVDPNLKLSF